MSAHGIQTSKKLQLKLCSGYQCTCRNILASSCVICYNQTHEVIMKTRLRVIFAPSLCIFLNTKCEALQKISDADNTREFDVICFRLQWDSFRVEGRCIFHLRVQLSLTKLYFIRHLTGSTLRTWNYQFYIIYKSSGFFEHWWFIRVESINNSKLMLLLITFFAQSY